MFVRHTRVPVTVVDDDSHVGGKQWIGVSGQVRPGMGVRDFGSIYLTPYKTCGGDDPSPRVSDWPCALVRPAGNRPARRLQSRKGILSRLQSRKGILSRLQSRKGILSRLQSRKGILSRLQSRKGILSRSSVRRNI